MFYCGECAKENNWPDGWAKSHGPCEICKRTRLCSDVPSSQLPPAKPKPEEEYRPEL